MIRNRKRLTTFLFLLLFLQLLCLSAKVYAQNKSWSIQAGFVKVNQKGSLISSGSADSFGSQDYNGNRHDGFLIGINKSIPLSDRLSFNAGFTFIRYRTWIYLSQNFEEFRLTYPLAGHRYVYQMPLGINYSLIKLGNTVFDVGGRITLGFQETINPVYNPVPWATNYAKSKGFMIQIGRNFENEVKRKPMVGGQLGVNIGPIFKRVDLGWLYHWDFNNSSKIAYSTEITYFRDIPPDPITQPDFGYNSSGVITPRSEYWILQLGYRF